MVPNQTTIIIQPNIPRQRENERERFISTLIGNLKSAIEKDSGIIPDIEKLSKFVLIKTDDSSVMNLMERVFGIETVREVIDVELISTIMAEGTISIEDVMSDSPRVISNGNKIQNEKEIVSAVREAIAERGLGAMTTGWVLLHHKRAFVSIKDVQGIGGLPTGIEGRVVCMISSGLDSPVAAFKAIRRGCIPIFVYFDNSPFSDDVNREVAIAQAKVLSGYVHGHDVKMLIVPHGNDLVEVLKYAPRRMTCVFCRRNMYRMAQEVALREGADAIITGEIIGEQASQTTRNLYAEEDAIDQIPVIRPCIGDDKDEITALARVIGTYEFTNAAASCCSLPPKYPVLHANMEKIASSERDIGYDWVKDAVSDAEVIMLKEV